MCGKEPKLMKSEHLFFYCDFCVKNAIVYEKKNAWFHVCCNLLKKTHFETKVKWRMFSANPQFNHYPSGTTIRNLFEFKNQTRHNKLLGRKLLHFWLTDGGTKVNGCSKLSTNKIYFKFNTFYLMTTTWTTTIFLTICH